MIICLFAGNQMKIVFFFQILVFIFFYSCSSTGDKNSPRKANPKAIENLEWSGYIGLMNWYEAASQCSAIGMRLPTFTEIQDSESNGITKSWHEDILNYLNQKKMEISDNTTFDIYWTSTPDEKGNQGIYYAYSFESKAYLSRGTAFRQVRCVSGKSERTYTQTWITKTYRGISFFPKKRQVVKSMLIAVPEITDRYDSIQAQLKYPISFFKADCQQQSECFSLLIDVSVIPEKTKNFKTLVQDSIKKDFGSPPNRIQAWENNLKFKTDPMEIYFGQGELVGNKAIAFYYDKKNEETYRVTINMIFMPNFSQEDWDKIIFHVFMILDSIQIN